MCQNSNTRWERSLSSFFSQFWVDEITKLSRNFKALREKFYKQIIHFKVTFTFDFHLSITIGTWNTNSDLSEPFLSWWRYKEEPKLQSFEMVVLKRNTLLQFFFYYWLLFFYQHWKMKYNFRPLWTQFGLITSSRESKLQYFWKKWSQEQTLPFQVSSTLDLRLSITLDTWYTTLGIFYTIWVWWRQKRGKYSWVLKN